MKDLPTYDTLRKIFNYNEDTGVLMWIDSASKNPNAKIGHRAGRVHSSGYRRVQIDGKVFLEHRVIWVWMTGERPPQSIDHINRSRADNRWSNLRAATLCQQAWNALAKSSNACGIRGVYFAADRKKWVAQIRLDGRLVRLGSFSTKEEAADAYQTAGRSARGEFFPT